ncbi:MAG: hypothetical protein ACD_19C00145G0002 [uncultured bacterium]|nr:MAG: hypothetical protein ACD_19C00145G0002 [uncultured bacterium]
MLSTKAIHEFKEIYQEEFGVLLGDMQAMELANKFLNTMRIVLKPLSTKIKNEEHKQSKKV